LEKAGLPPDRARSVVDSELDRLPSQSGQAGLQVSPNLNEVLVASFNEAKQLKDEYVSTEHLLLALLEVASPAKQVLTTLGMTRKSLLAAMRDLRGSQPGRASWTR
jgi:ATP-dependent Clp protease ATP-binding subunit ClpB